MALAISEGKALPGSGDHLIAVQPAGRRPPVFAVLGTGGFFVAYTTLAAALGPDQPFYSLEMPGLDGDDLPLERVEDIAARFCRELRGVRPGDPCVLMGACAGALVVFEMARILAAEGRGVDWLIMLDPAPTGTRRARTLSSHRLWRHLLIPRFLLGRAWTHLRTALALRGTRRRQFLREKVTLVHENLRARDLFRTARREIQSVRVMEAAAAALYDFEPRPYAGRVALFLGDRYAGATDSDPPASDWRALCTGSLQITRLPGRDSGQMLRPPHVDVLVRCLRELLARG